MNFSLIFQYSARALSFAVIITLFYVALHWKQPWQPHRFILKCLMVFYLSALIQITVIRNWEIFFQFLNHSHSLSSIQLIPLKTILEAYKLGFGSFVYHVMGNLIWFIPFGLLYPFLSVQPLKKVVFYAFLLSFSIEVLQWLFVTGVSDIDDILLNVLGAMIGLGIAHFMIYKKVHHQMNL